MAATPRPLDHRLHEEMNQCGLRFLAHVHSIAREAYGAEFFDGLHEGPRLALLFNFAMQAIVSPEACGLPQLDLDAVAKGVGIGLGARCAHLDQQQSTQFFGLLAAGYHSGQVDALTGAAMMITKGSA